MVSLAGIEKEYGGEKVLRGVSLELAAGELTALVGRSGSGKSTLLHVIGGLDQGYRGRARVLGVDLASLDDRGRARFRNAQVGFVFQAFHLLEHLSCAENVALPSYFEGSTATGDGAPRDPLVRAAEALDRVGIADHARRLPGQLSGGQKQRVAIARALFHRPPLLLADEPTGNLDSETGQKIIALFQALNGDGLTLLIVTHEERVSQATRRVIRLDDGRIVAEAGASA
ncbi:MAG: ABC transporter ATP-binding protein [Myxococcales bacterium]|nr:ABC transporter ATP-binding protein [Myxococcales bacterium]